MMRLAALGLALALGAGHPTQGPMNHEAPQEAQAPLFKNLGAYHRAISTASPEAQDYFDQGLRLLYAFNLEEAQRSFEAAAKADPKCGLCAWGVAMSLGPHINLAAQPDRTKAGHEAARRAAALTAGASPVEKALIDAVTRRFADPPPSDPAVQARFDKDYADAMRDVARQFPDDLDAAALAAALWETGWYEARLLTSFVDEPARVTPEQMDRWCRDFDNWGICDTLCFHLFDRTPHAWPKVAQWSGASEEFVKRAAFALLASLAGHDKKAADEQFLETLPWIERAATDERNFVKKGVSWALRMTGRRNPSLNAAAVEVAQRLAASPEPAARWIGKDALKDFARWARPADR